MAPAPLFHPPRLKAPVPSPGSALFASGPGTPTGRDRAVPMALSSSRRGPPGLSPRGPCVGPRQAEDWRWDSAPHCPDETGRRGGWRAARPPRRGCLSAFLLLFLSAPLYPCPRPAAGGAKRTRERSWSRGTLSPASSQRMGQCRGRAQVSGTGGRKGASSSTLGRRSLQLPPPRPVGGIRGFPSV